MKIEKVYYNGKCVMIVDMDYIDRDSMYEHLQEILGLHVLIAGDKFCRT